MTDMQAAPPTVWDAVLAEVEAERERQVNGLLAIRRAGIALIESDEGPCSDGVNDWLRRQNVPDTHMSDERARAYAEERVPAVQNPDDYSVLGLQRQLREMRERAATWLRAFADSLRQAQRDEGFNRVHVTNLLNELGAVELHEPGVHVSIGVTLNITAPATSVPAGATDMLIARTAEQAIRTALTGMVRNNRQGRFEIDDDGLDVDVTVTRN